MTGFREFSQQKAPIDQLLLEICEAAKIQVQEDWEEEFLTDVTERVKQGWLLSIKQLDVLKKLSEGYYAEMRERQHNGEEDRSYDPDRD